MSRFFRHRGLKLIEVSISMVSAIRLSFTAKLIMEKMKIIDETNLMNFENATYHSNESETNHFATKSC